MPSAGAQAREERPQRGVLGRRRLAGPERADQLLAPDVAGAVQQQVREQQADLPTAQALGALDSADLDREASTQLYTGRLTGAGRHGNVLETYRQRRLPIFLDVDRAYSDNLDGAHPEVTVGNGRGATIEGNQRIAQCECGAALAGASDDELFDAVQKHLAQHHPQLLGALEPEVVFQMAEAVGGATIPTGARGQST